MTVYEFNICKSHFFDTAVADILRAIDGGSLMGSFILSFCCIDYMGMALHPEKGKNTSDNFKEFVREYMGEVNPTFRRRGDEMWAVRNSLIHVYGQSAATDKMDLDFIFSHKHPENHLQVVHKEKRDEIWFSLPDFVGELIASIEFFFRSKRGNKEHLKTWCKKLIKIRGSGVLFERLQSLHNNPPIHRRSHRHFKILDDEPPVQIQEVKKAITSKLNEQLADL